VNPLGSVNKGQDQELTIQIYGGNIGDKTQNEKKNKAKQTKHTTQRMNQRPHKKPWRVPIKKRGGYP